MTVLVYAHRNSSEKALLEKEILATKPEIKMEFFHSISRFAQRLSQVQNDTIIAVLLAPDDKTLTNLLSIRELLLEVDTILIAADAEKNTMKKGAKLQPNYMSALARGFSEVADMVAKLYTLKWQRLSFKPDDDNF